MKAFLEKILRGKRVLLLGFGVEGQSTYRLLRWLFPDLLLTIADQRTELPHPSLWKHPRTKTVTGAHYLDGLNGFDVVIKSPGIRMNNLTGTLPTQVITSQTALFLQAFRNQVIGITGTKGKTTTAHLLHHVLQTAGVDTLLVGNMGLPPFEILDQIGPDTLVVFEHSSHQLEYCQVSPHIAVLLNIHQEHLDHYASYKHYQMAKFNIALHQRPGDWFVYAGSDEKISALLDEFPVQSTRIPYGFGSKSDGLVWEDGQVLYTNIDGKPHQICDMVHIDWLQGRHNQLNLMAVATVSLFRGVEPAIICQAAATFKTLPHRLEKLGEFGGKMFYNDSIATIPEATIFALEALQNVDCLIIGGYDRGIDYGAFVRFLEESSIGHLVFTGAAGWRIFEDLNRKPACSAQCSFYATFDEAARAAIEKTAVGKCCLLSPAASSYDQFRNFEHRGNRFREIVEAYFNAHKPS